MDRRGLSAPSIQEKIVQLRRFATGADFLMIQGWPLGLIQHLFSCGLSDIQFQHLAGNSFELGACAAAIIAALTHMPNPIKKEGSDDDEGTLDEIADLFQIAPSID